MTFPFVDTHSGADWKRWGGQNYEVVDGSVTLKTADRFRYASPAALLGEPSLPSEIVDMDVDDCGDLWLLAGDGIVRRYDPTRDDLRRIHCTWDEPPEAPRGIAVTANTMFIAIGTTDQAADGEDEGPLEDDSNGRSGGRIHAFSRHLMQTRWIAETAYPDPVSLVRNGETVSVLDRGDDGTEAFVAVVGTGGDPVSPATGFRQPVDLAVDEAGDRYVLDRDPDGSRHTVETVPAGGATVERVVPASDFVTASDGDVLRPDSLAAGLPDEIIVGDSSAAAIDASIFSYRRAKADFEAISAYTGPVENLLVWRGDMTRGPGLYVVGRDNGLALSFLPAAEHNRLNPDTGRYDGQVVTRFDAGQPEVQWHRLTADLDTTALGTQVRISYFATDDEDLRFHEPGTEPVIPLTRVDGIGPVIADRLRSAYVQGLRELVHLAPQRVAAIATTDEYYVSADRAGNWIAEAVAILDRVGAPDAVDWQSVGPPDPEDALLRDAVGRYLWVKVELIGTASAAPQVHSFRAYFPRQSYLRYLPAIYRRDAQAEAFLERYLSLFESVFTDIEEEISAATRYLDPDGVPGEALSWLGGWLALSPDRTWSTADERDLVRRAHDLFKGRGTRRGLYELLSIYLDEPSFPDPWQWAVDRQAEALGASNGTDEPTAIGERKLFIWEQQDLACIREDDRAVRELYEKLFPCPQCFAVLVWPFIDDDAIREVERIVDATSPAHTVGNVIPLHPPLRLTGQAGETGNNTFLGMNSVLVERDFEVGSSNLGTTSELSDHEPSGQVGTKGRLGTDTRIS